jgi:hypothetical protein
MELSSDVDLHPTTAAHEAPTCIPFRNLSSVQ